MMRNYRNSLSLRGAMAALFVLSLICASGCGGGKSAKGNTLTGKVTYRDEPLTGGSITLQSPDGKAQFKATIAPDGGYTIGGATTGEMIVTIETESIKGKTGVSYQAPPGRTAPEMGMKLEKYVEIPRSYGDPSSSPLRVTVKKGSNKANFNLNESGQ
jgi:hypothetical protein